jgi:protease I
MKALIISADNFEDSELLVPLYRLKEADVEVTVAFHEPRGYQGQARLRSGRGQDP